MIFKILYIFLMILEILTAFLLISVILIQKPKSMGAGLSFGAGVGEMLFGARMGNILTRITVILCIFFLVDTMLLGLIQTRIGKKTVLDMIESSPVPSNPLIPQISTSNVTQEIADIPLSNKVIPIENISQPTTASTNIPDE